MAEFVYHEETPFIPPDGVRPGLLVPHPSYERAQSIRVAPGFRTIPRSEWPEWIAAKNNNSSYVWNIYDQDGVGSCACESCYGAFKVIREACGLERVEFNPWAAYNLVSGGVDRGSTLPDNLNLLRDTGAFPESVWPRSKGWRTRPPQEAFDAAAQYRIDEYYQTSSWDEAASAMLLGWILYYGRQGHALFGVDLLNDRQFRYGNSWGQWGSASPFNDEVTYGFGVDNGASIEWGYGAYAFRTPKLDKAS